MEFYGGQARRLAEPPRHVPLSLKISLLFGGPLNTIGWVFLGFGGIFFWLFAMQGDYSFISFAGSKSETTGVITLSEKTNASEGGSDNHPGTPIYANYYQYTVNGIEFNSVSYATGRRLTPGRTIEIEYLLSNPGKSRIKNMRRALFPPFVVFVVIFPLIGLGLVIATLRSAFKSIHLLRIGRSTSGQLKSKLPTNTTINNRRVYRLTFGFIAADGRKGEVSVRAHDTSALEDDESERLLYDPKNLDSGITFDDLPNKVRIDAAGNLYSGVYLATLGNLLLPLITIGGHGWWIYFNYFAP